MEKAGTLVAEALSLAHTALFEDLQKLEQTVHPSRGDDPTELRARLEATHAHLLTHFQFEEESGYMEAVRKREPRLDHAVQQLAEEHQELRQSLDALIQEARAATNLDEALRTKVALWTDHVRRHEARETNLVQEAFNWDVSAED